MLSTVCPQNTLDGQDVKLTFFHWYNQLSKDALNSAVVQTLCGSQVKKTENLNYSVCFSVAMFLVCTSFSVAPDMILPDYICEDPITMFSYFAEARKFGNMVHSFLYSFLNLGLFCACYIALFNVHHLIVFLRYFSITESRHQRIFTFLFKHGFLLC